MMLALAEYEKGMKSVISSINFRYKKIQVGDSGPLENASTRP